MFMQVIHMNICFLVPTCELQEINSSSTCTRCVNSIRKFYQETDIIIINDSPSVNDSEIIKYFGDAKLISVSPSTKGSACSYALNYLSGSSYEYGVVIHDSTELVNFLPELNFDIKFFGYFDIHNTWETTLVPQQVKANVKTHKDEIFDMAINLENSLFKSKFSDYYYKYHLWRGCMGNMVVISNKYLAKLNNNTQILSLSSYIITRRDRMCMESIFGMAVFYDKKFDPADIFSYSIGGNYFSMWDPKIVEKCEYNGIIYTSYNCLKKYNYGR